MFQLPASVQLSGPAFSFLLYETCKADLRQDGFLLGEIIHKEIISITDNDQRQVTVNKIIKINSVMPIAPGSEFFAKGRVDKEKLHTFLGVNFDKVVAWYKYQPYTTNYFEFTLKDKAIHKQLRELFDISADLFTCCFMSMEFTDSQATFKYIQSFQRYHNGAYDRLIASIPNLSEPNNTYKNSEPASFSFNKILSSLNVNIQNSKGIVAITEIESAVQKYINGTAAELAKREKYLYELEQEVWNLKKSSPHIDVEAEQMETSLQNDKYEAEEDLISFDEEPPEARSVTKLSYAQKVAQKNEISPEFQRKTVARGKIRKKSESSDTEAEIHPQSDSNKREAVEAAPRESPNNAFETSPQRTRNSNTAATPTRGRGSGARSRKPLTPSMES